MAKLYFYYSAMNAGKSTVLLQSSYNYQERGMDTIIFSPSIDDRYGVGKVTSRIGLQSSAVILDDKLDMYDYVKSELKTKPKLACILVDEAHFLKKQDVEALCKIVDQLGLPVLTYGLRSDYKSEPFEGSVYLLALADELVELKTVCHCGRKAIMNMRVDAKGEMVKSGEQIVIGGNETYVSTCRAHYAKGKSGIFKTKEVSVEL